MCNSQYHVLLPVSGGNTRRSASQYLDCAGVCNSQYHVLWTVSGGNTRQYLDFSGVCNSQYHVLWTVSGGNTGRSASQYLDCAGVCNGTNVLDSCGMCVRPTPVYPRGSKYMDCTGKCISKGECRNSNRYRAE